MVVLTEEAVFCDPRETTKQTDPWGGFVAGFVRIQVVVRLGATLILAV